MVLLLLLEYFQWWGNFSFKRQLGKNSFSLLVLSTLKTEKKFTPSLAWEPSNIWKLLIDNQVFPPKQITLVPVTILFDKMYIPVYFTTFYLEPFLSVNIPIKCGIWFALFFHRRNKAKAYWVPLMCQAQCLVLGFICASSLTLFFFFFK